MISPQPLGAGDVEALVERLRAARRAIADRAIDDRIHALGRVAEGWLEDRDAIAAAASAIGAQTGYAPSMIATCLERTLRAWSTAPLRALVDEALLAPGSIATPPELVVAVLAQNTPGLAVAPAFSALALGAAVVLKCARGETSFAPRLAERIAAVDSELGAACEARAWTGGDPVERELFAHASRVVVYGPRDAVEHARAIAGERIVACGPRISLAVVATMDDPQALAERLARDVAFLDQRGCLSPQVILVAEEVDRAALGHALARALAEVERGWPRRRLSAADATAFRRAVDDAEARSLAGEDVLLLGGVHEPWAVVVEPSSALTPSPLDRFVRLHPFVGPAGLRAALRPLLGRVECVGLAGGERRHALAAVCREAGVARVCDVGRMQDPPADWHAGGRRPLAAYLSWSGADETAEPPEATSDPSERRARFLRFVAQTSDSPRGIEVERARGSWVWARDGRRYLDLLAGIGVASIGHAHPRVAAAVARQSARYTHVMVYGEDVLAPQVDLAERLAARLPPSLSVSYFTNSGAEAIEGALKLVRKATGRTRVVAFEGAYHGDTTGALALGGNPFYREPFRPLVEPVVHLPWNEASALDRIDASTAAVFTEPVQAEGGVRVPAPDFLPRLARRCREVGALLVLDEVVTGLGRTGRWFGFEHFPESRPDVIVLAKALGGGLPLGAFVTSPELSRVLAVDPPLGHVTTFGGNPVSCAAGLASLEVLTTEELPARAAALGTDLVDRLGSALAGDVEEIRGLGLLIGLEFGSAERTAAFVDACRDEGVLLGWTLHRDRVVRLAPPLTITEDEIDHAVGVMQRAAARTRTRR